MERKVAVQESRVDAQRVFLSLSSFLLELQAGRMQLLVSDPEASDGSCVASVARPGRTHWFAGATVKFDEPTVSGAVGPSSKGCPMLPGAVRMLEKRRTPVRTMLPIAKTARRPVPAPHRSHPRSPATPAAPRAPRACGTRSRSPYAPARRSSCRHRARRRRCRTPGGPRRA